MNRREHVHSYKVRRYGMEGHFPEWHVLHERIEHEHAAAREGRRHVEEHRDQRSHSLHMFQQRLLRIPFPGDLFDLLVVFANAFAERSDAAGSGSSAACSSGLNP